MKKSDTKPRHPILSHPYPAALLLMIWGIVFYNFIMQAPAYFLLGSEDSLTYFSSALGGILLMVIHRFWFRGEYRGSFRRGTSLKKNFLLASIVFLAADILIWIIDISRMGFSPLSFTMLGAALMAGFGEESVFRVLVISTMMRSYKDKNTYMPALIFSALCFGGIHLLNIGSEPLSTAILQVVCCIGTGLFFGSIYLRTGSIILPVILHTLHDILSFMVLSQANGAAAFELTTADIVENLILCAVTVILAVLLLKGHKDEIIDVWKERWNTEN